MNTTGPIPLEVEELPEGWTPLAMFAVVKCLDEDGDLAMVTRASDDLTSWEAIGLLTAALDTQRQNIQGMFEEEEDA